MGKQKKRKRRYFTFYKAIAIALIEAVVEAGTASIENTLVHSSPMKSLSILQATTNH
jgi:hypothetical protein